MKKSGNALILTFSTEFACVSWRHLLAISEQQLQYNAADNGLPPPHNITLRVHL